VVVERLFFMVLAAGLVAASAISETARPAAKEDLVKLTQTPAVCAASDKRAQGSCFKELGTQVRRLSSASSNVHLMQGLPILDQKAATTALCDIVKTWADQSLGDIRSVWKYLEKHEADWPPQMKNRVEGFGKQQIGAKLETLRETAGLGKPCGWVAWGSFKTFGSKVAASQQSAPEVVAEIAEVLSKGLSKGPGDVDALEASKAFLRAIGNAASPAPK
jgi:hypothetical protein